MRTLLLALIFIFTGTSMAVAENPKVVASVKPIHSLVAAVMGDTGNPELLVSGGASPHTFTLKPSHAATLTNADLVFWVGPDLEGFLINPVANLVEEQASIPLARSQGIEFLEAREGGVWEPHHHHEEHGEEDEDTDEHQSDPHIWLDIDNALVLITEIETRLATTYPSLAPVFSKNAMDLRAELQQLDIELKNQLNPVRTQPYIVFHDAYQYFEKRYGLSPSGSVTANPEVRPGARRISDLKNASDGAICVFAEPQFEARILQLLTEDDGVRLGYLDPLGSALPQGADHYAATLRALATSISDCLSQ